MPVRPPAPATTRGPVRIELDWDALEIAVERNSPDTDSYLDLTTGRVLTITTGDPEAAINRQNDRNDSPANYCQNMVNIQTPFLAANQAVLATGPSPVPAVGENLFTFLANRLLMSFDNLGCKSFGLTNPVTVVLDGAGATTSATINTTPQQASIVGGAGATGGGGGGTGDGGTGGGVGAQAAWQQIWQQWTSQGGQRKGRDHHQLMDPSGE